MHNILIVDKTMDAAMSFIDTLSRPSVDVTFNHQTTQALKNVKRNDYDLIIMGDRLDDGTTYDVALGIKDSKKNKQIPIVCVGVNKGKVARIMKLLRPYSFCADVSEVGSVTVSKVIAYLENKE